MFYLRKKGTRDEFMKERDLYHCVKGLDGAHVFKTAKDAETYKQLFKGSLGTVDRSGVKFEVVSKKVAEYGINE